MSDSSLSLPDLMDATKENGASDLHLSSGMPPMLRLHGDIEIFDAPPLDSSGIYSMLESITTKHQWEVFKNDWELDFSYQHGESARFRVNAFQQTRGPSIACRIIPNTILSLDDLGAPRIFKSIITQHRGLVLVTGPTGSGKSTTLAAMINEINTSRRLHIITVEDPVEFVHQPSQSLINQREIGTHTKSFSASLRSALREDPDVILVGEMRDPETISLALTAAETGHLVFGTLHTNSASKTIDRVIDSFSADEQNVVRAMLSESLRAVISQLLIKKASGGRIAVHEIMLSNPSIRNLIRENKVPQMYSAIQIGQKAGMQTLDQALKVMVEDQTISKAEALKFAISPTDFRT